MSVASTALPTAPSAIVRGLKNTGNSCFLNCALQALSSLADVHRFLHDIQASWHELDTKGLRGAELLAAQKKRKRQSLAMALQQTLTALRKPESDAFEPTEVTTIPEVGKFMNQEQQDAQELIQLLLSAMDDEEQATELAITATVPVSERVPEFNTLVFLPTRQYAHVPAPPGYVPWLYPKKKYGALQNPFNGTFVNGKACPNCHTTRSAMEGFNTIPLTLPKDAPDAVCSIESCLADFTKTELVEGVVCDSCSTRVRTRAVLKTTHIGTPPRVLCLYLKRLSYNPATGEQEKSRTNVTFGTTLNLVPYLAPAYRNRPAMYSLSSLVVHTGASGSGHFMTIRRVPTDGWAEPTFKAWIRGEKEPAMEWALVSDSWAKPMTEADMIGHGTNVYLLFYTLQAPPPSPVSLEHLNAPVDEAPVPAKREEHLAIVSDPRKAEQYVSRVADRTQRLVERQQFALLKLTVLADRIAVAEQWAGAKASEQESKKSAPPATSLPVFEEETDPELKNRMKEVEEREKAAEKEWKKAELERRALEAERKLVEAQKERQEHAQSAAALMAQKETLKENTFAGLLRTWGHPTGGGGFQIAPAASLLPSRPSEPDAGDSDADYEAGGDADDEDKPLRKASGSLARVSVPEKSGALMRPSVVEIDEEDLPSKGKDATKAEEPKKGGILKQPFSLKRALETAKKVTLDLKQDNSTGKPAASAAKSGSLMASFLARAEADKEEDEHEPEASEWQKSAARKSKLLALSQRINAQPWGYFQQKSRLAKAQRIASRLSLREVPLKRRPFQRWAVRTLLGNPAQGEENPPPAPEQKDRVAKSSVVLLDDANAVQELEEIVAKHPELEPLLQQMKETQNAKAKEGEATDKSKAVLGTEQSANVADAEPAKQATDMSALPLKDEQAQTLNPLRSLSSTATRAAKPSSVSPTLATSLNGDNFLQRLVQKKHQSKDKDKDTGEVSSFGFSLSRALQSPAAASVFALKKTAAPVAAPKKSAAVKASATKSQAKLAPALASKTAATVTKPAATAVTKSAGTVIPKPAIAATVAPLRSMQPVRFGANVKLVEIGIRKKSIVAAVPPAVASAKLVEVKEVAAVAVAADPSVELPAEAEEKREEPDVPAVERQENSVEPHSPAKVSDEGADKESVPVVAEEERKDDSSRSLLGASQERPNVAPTAVPIAEDPMAQTSLILPDAVYVATVTNIATIDVPSVAEKEDMPADNSPAAMPAIVEDIARLAVLAEEKELPVVPEATAQAVDSLLSTEATRASTVVASPAVVSEEKEDETPAPDINHAPVAVPSDASLSSGTASSTSVAAEKKDDPPAVAVHENGEVDGAVAVSTVVAGEKTSATSDVASVVDETF